MLKKRVSFIVPVYNVEGYIERCLNSIFPFLVEGHQMIIVNDGSTDNSFTIAQKFKRTYNNLDISIVSQENRGLSAARNKGLQFATGDYVWFVDSDDYLSNESLKIIHDRTIFEEDCDLIVFGRKEEYNHSVIPVPSDLDKEIFMSGRSYFAKEVLCHKFRTQVWDKLFKRSLIKSEGIHFEEGMLYEDMYFLLRYLIVAEKVITWPLYPYIYNRRNTFSITNRVRHKDLDVLTFVEMADDYLIKINMYKELELPYNLLVFNWISSCLLSKYAKLSYSNSDALMIYDKAFNHDSFKRALNICRKSNVGIRRRLFAIVGAVFPFLFKPLLIFALFVQKLIFKTY